MKVKKILVLIHFGRVMIKTSKLSLLYSICKRRSALNEYYTKMNNNNDSKFKAGDHVKKSKYKNHFCRKLHSNWSKEVFMIR